MFLYRHYVFIYPQSFCCKMTSVYVFIILLVIRVTILMSLQDIVKKTMIKHPSFEKAENGTLLCFLPLISPTRGGSNSSKFQMTPYYSIVKRKNKKIRKGRFSILNMGALDLNTKKTTYHYKEPKYKQLEQMPPASLMLLLMTTGVYRRY